jgi:hypothetical protein
MKEEKDKVIIDLDEGENLDLNLDLNPNADEGENLDLTLDLKPNVDEDENISFGKRLLISIWFSIKFWAFIALIFGIHSVITYNPRRHSSSGTRQKACYSNIRVIQGAVEMYNMDHSVMISSLDDSEAQNPSLLKGYLKGVHHPYPKCCYQGIDLGSGDGGIWCTYHGDVDGILGKEGLYDKEQNNDKSNIKGIFAIIGILSIPTILRFCWTYL